MCQSKQIGLTIIQTLTFKHDAFTKKYPGEKPAFLLMNERDHIKLCEAMPAFSAIFYQVPIITSNLIAERTGICEGYAMTVPKVEVHNSPIELRQRSFCKYSC